MVYLAVQGASDLSRGYSKAQQKHWGTPPFILVIKFSSSLKGDFFFNVEQLRPTAFHTDSVQALVHLFIRQHTTQNTVQKQLMAGKKGYSLI